MDNTSAGKQVELTAARAILFWSGGKDSALSLARCLGDNSVDVKLLLTTVDTTGSVAMHGIPEALIRAQSDALDIPVELVSMPPMPGMDAYEAILLSRLAELKIQFNITHAVFGDIFLEDLREYRENLMRKAGLEPFFPLWGTQPGEVMDEFFRKGFRAQIVCSRGDLEHLSGSELTEDLIDAFPPGIDAAGENGEYHTFVFDGPIFNKPVRFDKGRRFFTRYSNAPEGEASPGFWFTTLEA